MLGLSKNKEKEVLPFHHNDPKEPNPFKYSVNDLDFHDPKSIKSIASLLQNSPVSQIYTNLHTDPTNGTSVDETDLRIKFYGSNILPTRKTKSFFRLIFEAMQDKVLIVLSIAAIVSLALGLYETFGQPVEYDSEGKPKPRVEWVEGVAIIVAIVIVVVVGAANDYQKERQFAKLNQKKENTNVVVIRNAQKTIVSIHEILVGDLVFLQSGDVVPADGFLTSGSLQCDESALTGETNSIKKFPMDVCIQLFESFNKDIPMDSDDIIDLNQDTSESKALKDPYLISGAKVLEGQGCVLITAVGTHSIHGRTMQLLQETDEDLDSEASSSPLQVRLDKLAGDISKYGLLVALILFIVLFIRFCTLLPSPHKYSFLTGAQKGEKFLNILIVAITIVVVAVPEGLPLAVTLALAFATTRMAKDNNLVRVLKSCETMGGATAICSDKTGTLTENKMRVVRAQFSNGVEFNDLATSESKDLKRDDVKKDIVVDDHENLLINCVMNSSAFENEKTDENDDTDLLTKELGTISRTCTSIFGKNKNKKESEKKDEEVELQEPYNGSKTEVALLILCNQLFDVPEKITHYRETVMLEKYTILQTIPFESVRKWSAVVIKNNSTNEKTLFIKGAAEIISNIADYSLNSKSKEEISSTIDTFARNALRSICLAHVTLNDDASTEFVPLDADTLLSNKVAENKLIIDGIVGIQNPLRHNTAKSIEACHIAGVTVRMITGDNLITGRSIAKACGIIESSDDSADDDLVCIEGPKFRALLREDQLRIIPKLRVLARSSPEDKRILVLRLQEMGEVVAVTGDGTNDAPALKLAHVGFSMGVSGTDVAREASDIILMTDDFGGIVQAIKWGRCVSSSIKKFIQFQLTVNVTAVVLTFVSAVADEEGKSVLTAVQLLWVNLIMDTLAALALATDKPDDDILKSKPAGTKAPLINVAMWKMIGGQSTVQLCITFVLHFAGKDIFYGKDTEISGHEQSKLDAMTFNTFVWLQFFCMFVARKLDEGDGLRSIKERISMRNLNFFSHLFRNWYFLIIMLIISGFQILIMFVGGAAFSVSRQTGAMWGTAIICGLVSIPMGAFIRIIPDWWVEKAFPTKAWKAMLAILTLSFLRKNKKKQFFELEEEEFGSTSNSEGTSEIKEK